MTHKFRDDEITVQFNTGAWRPEPIRVVTEDIVLPKLDLRDDEPTIKIELDPSIRQDTHKGAA